MLLYITYVYVFCLVLSTEYRLCQIALSCTELFTVHTVTSGTELFTVHTVTSGTEHRNCNLQGAVLQQEFMDDLIMKFLAFYGIRRFITVLTTARYSSLTAATFFNSTTALFVLDIS